MGGRELRGAKGKASAEAEPATKKVARKIQPESPGADVDDEDDLRLPKRRKAAAVSQPHDYTHLLQPIRDLAANWDVDLANELEEYIAEIEKITYSFDGLHNLNFAEAALLIQGSACVYSRKVEYLYNLVYQTLEMVSSKRKRLQSSLDEEGVDNDANAVDADDAAFLTLDDMEASNNIDLIEDGPRARQKAALLQRTPIAFLPQLEKAISNSNVDIITASGDVVGKRDDFKMNTSMIHESGALILDTSDFHKMDKNLRPIGKPAQAASSRLMPSESLSSKGAAADLSPGADRHAAAEGHRHPNDDHYDDDYDDGGGDYDTGAWPAAPARELDVASPQFARLGRHERADESLGDYVDPWAMVDPHSKGSLPEKPFKKGKTFRLPKIVAEKRKPLGDSQQMNKVLPTVTQFLTQIKSLQKNQKASSKSAIKGSLYPEFDYLYAQESKRRKTAIQKEKDHLELTVRRGNDPWNSIPPIVEFGGEDDSGDEDRFDHGPLDHQNHQDDDPCYDDGDYGPSAPHDDVGPSRQATNPQIPRPEDDPDHLAPPMELDEQDHAVIETYEDMCRHQIETYLAQAQKYDQHLETSLSKRVREWEDKIKPLLGEQDSRPYFNVRLSGQEVLDKFQQKGLEEKSMLSLREVVGADPQVYEVIRAFMATLHLANSGNVDIKTKGSDMNLVLKSSVLHELEV